MKVKIVHNIAFEGNLLHGGKEYELPDKVAQYYLKRGFAEKIVKGKKGDDKADKRKTKVQGPANNKGKDVGNS